MVDSILEFLGSLSIFGWILIVLLILRFLNIGKVIRLRSPLDTQQHKLWRSTDGTTKPGHLEKKGGSNGSNQ